MKVLEIKVPASITIHRQLKEIKAAYGMVILGKYEWEWGSSPLFYFTLAAYGMVWYGMVWYGMVW
jgi:hypothetical protein